MMNRNDDVCRSSAHQISILWLIVRWFFPFIEILWTSAVASCLHHRWLISASIKRIEAWRRQVGEGEACIVMTPCLWLISPIRDLEKKILLILRENDEHAKPRASASFEDIWVLTEDVWRNCQNRPDWKRLNLKMRARRRCYLETAQGRLRMVI